MRNEWTTRDSIKRGAETITQSSPDWTFFALRRRLAEVFDWQRNSNQDLTCCDGDNGKTDRADVYFHEVNRFLCQPDERTIIDEEFDAPEVIDQRRRSRQGDSGQIGLLLCAIDAQ